MATVSKPSLSRLSLQSFVICMHVIFVLLERTEKPMWWLVIQTVATVGSLITLLEVKNLILLPR